MSRSVFSSVRVILLCVVALTLSCTIQGSFSFSAKISINTRVLKPEVAQRAEVAPESVTLPAADAQEAKVEPGSILVTDDFLRRVDRVDARGDKVELATSDASLSDIVEEGETSTEEDLAERTEIRSAWTQLSPQGVRWNGNGFEFDVDETIVEDPTSGARVWLEGKVTFRPRVAVGMSFKAFSLRSAWGIAHGDFSATLKVRGRLPVKSASYSITLWRSAPFTIQLPPIGVVPVRFTSQLAVRAYVNFQADKDVVVSAGVTSTGTGAIGFRYEDSQLKAVKEWTPSVQILPPTVESLPTAVLQAAIQAELEGGFYGGWGPLSAGGGIRLTAGPYLQAALDPAGVSARVAFRADADVFLRVLWREFPVTSIPVYPETELAAWPKAGAKSSILVPRCAPQSAFQCGSEPGCKRRCSAGEMCLTSADCAFPSSCSAGFCTGSAGGARAGQPCDKSSACGPGLLCTRETAPDGSVSGFCRPPLCTDRAANGDETDVDCGGPGCAPCVGGSKCRQSSDCVSRLCVGATPGKAGRCSR